MKQYLLYFSVLLSTIVFSQNIIASSLESYTHINGIIYSNNGNTRYPQAYVYGIEDNYKSSIENIVIPTQITIKVYSYFNGHSYTSNETIKVVAIKKGAFDYCNNLKTITIPSTIESIENDFVNNSFSTTTFFVDSNNSRFKSVNGSLYTKDMEELIRVPSTKMTITIPNTVKRIRNYALNGSRIQELYIPKNVESIGEYALSRTNNLTKISIDSENTHFQTDNSAIIAKDQKRIVALASGISFYNIPEGIIDCSSGVFTNNQNLKTIVLANSLKEIPDLTGCSNIENIISFKNINYNKLPIKPFLYIPSPYIATNNSNVKIKPLIIATSSQTKIQVESTNDFDIKTASFDETIINVTNKVTIPNIKPDTWINIGINGYFKDYYIQGNFYVKTLAPILNIEATNTTNTTLTLKGSYSGDMKVIKEDLGEYSNGNIALIKNLSPNQHVNCTYTITTEDGNTFSTSNDFWTKNIDLNVTCNTTSTSCTLTGSTNNIDADITYSGFSESKNDILKVTGLNPNTSYSYKYYVETKDGWHNNKVVTFTTKAIQLEALQPKGVTNTCSIVSAKSNIDDDEVTAGFQWRKYDAPSTLKPSEGYATVYNGTIEGFIKNLQPASYYNVRAFYKSNTDKYYYGDWVTFDPSDFSYFEPTVHTYARVSVQSTSAKVKGVALQGTDDITEQGFEYWAENTIASRAAGDKQIVQATGQSMEAEITDLAPNTTYNYRAYAKTSKGTTYGETLKFTTPVATAIIGIINTTNSELQFNVRNTNNVQIAINGTDKECNYRMNSITGANIASGKTTADGEWHSITNYQLPSGIYIITVSDGKDKKSTKIAIK